jgi:hypothetical protein
MRGYWHGRLLKSALACGLRGGAVLIPLVPAALAEDAAPRRPNWPSSEYHGKIDGNGNPIPCRCLYRGQSFQLGATVCMNTHKGTVMAECDLVQNNTSWVPTEESCTISRVKTPSRLAQRNYPLNKQAFAANYLLQ